MPKEAKIILGVSVAIIAAVVLLVIRASNESIKPVDLTLLVKDGSHMTGQKNAKVTVVEFGDYQCPACGGAHPIIKQLLEAYKTNPDFSFVFRNFPLPQHGNAQLAAESAEAAGDQGKFWEMHDKLYDNQDKWANLSSSEALNVFKGYATELGLDVGKFEGAVKDNKFSSVISQDMADARGLGVGSTPTFYINGIKFEGVLSLDQFKQEVEARMHQINF